MKLLVIYGSAPEEQFAWPWSSSALRVSIRHLQSADLAERIEQADFVALSVSCGMLRKPWAVVEKLLAERNVPMIAFERLDAKLMRAIRLGGTCVATLTDEGRVELQCRAQQSAFQRISTAVAAEGGYRGASLPANSADDGSKSDRVTRFVFQGK